MRFCMFLLFFSIMSFPKFVKMKKKQNKTKQKKPFYNFAWLSIPKGCTHVHHQVLKNNPNSMIFFYEDDI